MSLTFSSLSLKNVGLYPCCQRRPSSFHLCLNLLSNSISHFFHFRTLVFNFVNRWVRSRRCFKSWWILFWSIEWIFRTHCSSCYSLGSFKVFGTNRVSRFNMDIILSTFPSVALDCVLHHCTFVGGDLLLDVFLCHHVLGWVVLGENLVSRIVEEISIWCCCLVRCCRLRCCWSCVFTYNYRCWSSQWRASVLVCCSTNLEAFCCLNITYSPWSSCIRILFYFFW